MLSPTTGFLAEAGFTHSLSPARNCTFGCTYCYVPTLGIYGGLQPEDWKRWGQFTTFKPDVARAVRRELRPGQIIYCSPLVDPYQPPEAEARQMPGILEAVLQAPPRAFVIQTRGPLILRDLPLLQKIPSLRVSFSLTTDQEEVRRLYEPHCATIGERLETITALREAGIATFATLAPILPCVPENLVELALLHTDQPIVADPFHTRAAKSRGATTREAALRISNHHGYQAWHQPPFQQEIVERMAAVAHKAGRLFGTGPAAFAWLTGAVPSGNFASQIGV